MTRTPAPRTNVQKAAHVRARNLRRDVVRAFQEALDDGGLSRRAVCRAAGIGPNTLAAIERDDREPTIEVLARLAAVLGGELSVRFFPGNGPVIRDRLQAPMIESLLGRLHRSWTVELEVPVRTPSLGSIDLVLRRSDGTVIACEAHSELRRLEQQLRCARVKADALAAVRPEGTVSSVPGPRAVSRLLLLRACRSTIAVATSFRDSLRSAYPASHSAAVTALTGAEPWPGHAIVWMDVRPGIAVLRARPPRGVI